MLCYGTSMNIIILLTYLLKISLTYFMTLVFFSIFPELCQKTRSFLMFSGTIEGDLCHEMGLEPFNIQLLILLLKVTEDTLYK